MTFVRLKFNTVFFLYLRFSEDFVEASNKRGFQMLSKHGLVVVCYLNHSDIIGKFYYQIYGCEIQDKSTRSQILVMNVN